MRKLDVTTNALKQNLFHVQKQKFQNNFIKTEIRTFRLMNQQKIDDALSYTENLFKVLHINEGEVIFLDLLTPPKNRNFRSSKSVEMQLSALVYNCAVKTAQVYLQGPTFGGIFTNRVGILMRLLRQKNEQHSFVHNYLIRETKKLEYAIQALMPVLRLNAVNFTSQQNTTRYTTCYTTLSKLLQGKQFYHLPLFARLQLLALVHSQKKKKEIPIEQNQTNYVFTPSYTWTHEWLQRPKVVLIFGSITNQRDLVEFYREGLFIINFTLDEPQGLSDQLIALDKNNLSRTFLFFTQLFNILMRTKTKVHTTSFLRTKRNLFHAWTAIF